MHFFDLTETQIRDLDLFNLILEGHGWHDVDETEKRIMAGEDQCPEGRRMIVHGTSSLEAQFHAPLNMITLQITDIISHSKIRFYFFFDDKVERILEWLAGSSGKLNMDTYIVCLKEVFGKCEMILLELAKDEIYEVKPPEETVGSGQ